MKVVLVAGWRAIIGVFDPGEGGRQCSDMVGCGIVWWGKSGRIAVATEFVRQKEIRQC